MELEDELELGLGLSLGLSRPEQSRPASSLSFLKAVAPFLDQVTSVQQVFLAERDRGAAEAAEQLLARQLSDAPPLGHSSLSSFLRTHLRLNALLRDSLAKLALFTRSQRAQLYLSDYDSDEIYLCPTFIFSDVHRVNFKIGLGKTLATYVALKKEFVVTADVLEDERFPLGLSHEGMMFMNMKAAMGVPVITHNGELVAVIELSRYPNQPPYQKRDELAAMSLAWWVGATIGATVEVDKWHNRNRFFSHLRRMLKFYSTTTALSLETILSKFMVFTKQYINASAGRMFVINPFFEESFFKLVYSSKSIIREMDMYSEIENISGNEGVYDKIGTYRLKEMDSVPDYVIENNTFLNLTEVDMTKFEGFTKKENFHSVICYPVRGSKNSVLGALLFINKLNGLRFTKNDEQNMEYIREYATLLLKHSNNVKIVEKLDAMIGVFTDLIKRNLAPCHPSLQEIQDISSVPTNLFTFQFAPSCSESTHLAKLSKVILNTILGEDYFSGLELNQFLLTVSKANKKNKFYTYLQSFFILNIVSTILLKHEDYFTLKEKEEILLTATLHTMNVTYIKCTKSVVFEYSKYIKHFLLAVLEKFNLYTEDRWFSVFNLIRACGSKYSDVYMTSLLRLIANDSFDKNNPLHRFYVKSLILRVAERAMWYKPFKYCACLAKSLLDKCRHSKERKLSNKHKRRNKGVTKNVFLKLIIEQIIHEALPDIIILSYFLPDVDELFDLCSATLDQWQLIMNSNKSPIWQQGMTLTSADPHSCDQWEWPFDLVKTFTDYND